MSLIRSSGHVVDRSWVGRPIQGVATGRTHTVTVRRQLVPIVFVPGIMGSRLAYVPPSGKRQTVWDPDDIGFMREAYLSLFRSRPKAKKDLLIGAGVHKNGRLAPFVDDAEHNKRLTPEEAARGWGGVLWRSYGEFLRWLVAARRAQGPTLGMLSSGPAALVETPVFAFPYDWTSSCARSGARLAQYIPEAIAQARRELRAGDLACPGVILVTHSMGGLVARAACQAGAQVVGVVHGVQPAVGAAAAYWRMKAGFPRAHDMDVSAMALGKDGREVVALLGNMPGGLELLPTREYRAPDGDAAWLHWPNPDGSTTALPRGDAYTEIYAEAQRPWRLIPDPSWLDPARDAVGAEPAAPVQPPRADPYGAARAAPVDAAPQSATWTAYMNRVAAAAAFHAKLAGYQHPRSVHFWGVGGTRTPALVHFATCQERAPNPGPRAGGFNLDLASADDVCARLNAQEANMGEYTLWQPVSRGGSTTYPLSGDALVWRCVLRPASEGGDGTVPEASGAWLARGQASTGALPDIDHELAYQPLAARQFVGGAIARLLATTGAGRASR